MKIWKLDFDLDNYDNLTFANRKSIEDIQSFDGRTKKEIWDTPKVLRLEPEKMLPLSDAPGLYAHLPVFNKRAIKILSRLIENDTEILPLENNEDEFFAINVLKVLDCIDYNKSEFKTFSDGKRIMRFIRYSFIPCRLDDCNIFKIIDEKISRPFVTDCFRDEVISSNLKGFIFKQVWNSDELT